jgi:hypothetical protein
MDRHILEAASVLGVDVGWAAQKATTGACRLDWTKTAISFECSCATLGERPRLLRTLADRGLLVVALDGPLCSDLRSIDRYRLAEQLLTQRLGRRIGKPGQSSSLLADS